MKKIVVVLAMFALLASWVSAEVAVTGKVEIGWAGLFTADLAGPIATSDSGLDTELQFAAKVDDFNSATVKFKDMYKGTVVFDKASLESKIGAALDLPIGITLFGGYFENGEQNYGNFTQNDWTDVFGIKFKDWSVGLDAVIAPEATVRLQWKPTPTDAPVFLTAGLYGKMAGLGYEVFYGAKGEDLDLGRIGGGLGYTMAMDPLALSFGVNGQYELADTAAVAWKYGVSVKAVVDALSASVGLRGQEATELWGVGLDAKYAIMDGLNVYAAGIFNIDDTAGTEVLDLLEVTLEKTFGKTSFQIGYTMGEYVIDKTWQAEADFKVDGLFMDLSLSF